MWMWVSECEILESHTIIVWLSKISKILVNETGKQVSYETGKQVSNENPGGQWRENVMYQYVLLRHSTLSFPEDGKPEDMRCMS